MQEKSFYPMSQFMKSINKTIPPKYLGRKTSECAMQEDKWGGLGETCASFIAFYEIVLKKV